MDDVPGFEAIAAGDLGGAGVAAAERATFGEKLGPGGAMDGAVDAAAAEQRPVGGVDDGPDIERISGLRPGSSRLRRYATSSGKACAAASMVLRRPISSK